MAIFGVSRTGLLPSGTGRSYGTQGAMAMDLGSFLDFSTWQGVLLACAVALAALVPVTAR